VEGRRKLALLLALFFLAAAASAQKPDEASPKGAIVGKWPWIAGPEEVTRALAEASSASGHQVVLFVDAPHDSDSTEECARKLAAASPEETLLFVFTRDFDARVHPATPVRDRFAPALVGRMEHDLKVALTESSVVRTVARVVREVGQTAAGHPPEPWIAWKHPYQVLAGGPDADPVPLPFAVVATFLFFAIGGGFLYALITHPKRVLAEVAAEVGSGLIGGAIGSIGGGGGGGSSFSGGGGSSGGGGASGSW
jgi:uncharacterized membrane protein YgcG